MCQWDVEPFVPYRIGRVFNHARACHGGLGDRNGDVRVAGDYDLFVAVAVLRAIRAVGFVGRLTCFDRVTVTDCEATADMLCHDVHVG